MYWSLSKREVDIIVNWSILFFILIIELHLKSGGIFSERNLKLLAFLFDYFKVWLFLLLRLWINLFFRDNRILLSEIIFDVFVYKFLLEINVYSLCQIEKRAHKAAIFYYFFAIYLIFVEQISMMIICAW